MARELIDIENAIIADKNSRPELNALTSTSQTARWKQWVSVVASAIWAMEKLWDSFLTIITNLLANYPYIGTLPWYAKQAKLFQYSTSTSYYIDFDIFNRPQYNTIEPNDQIVKYSAATEGEWASVVIKAAKDLGGEPTQLNPTELAMFSDYIETIKVAGTRLYCISEPADPLKIEATIYFDPIAHPTLVQTQVVQAINNYLKNLPFNGIFYVEKIQDAIQSVTSVVSVEMTSVSVNYGAGPVVIDRVLETLSGYARVDVAYPLSSTLNFIASNV